MKYKFSGQVAYSVKSLQDFREMVLSDIINMSCDRDTVKYSILVTCFSSMKDHWASHSLTLGDGETFTFDINNDTGLKLECTNEDMTFLNGKFLGFSRSFAEDFEDLLDEILLAYDVREFINLNVKFE